MYAKHYILLSTSSIFKTKADRYFWIFSFGIFNPQYYHSELGEKIHQTTNYIIINNNININYNSSNTKSMFKVNEFSALRVRRDGPRDTVANDVQSLRSIRQKLNRLFSQGNVTYRVQRKIYLTKTNPVTIHQRARFQYMITVKAT